uniref:Uncharacterized protein n=1 Tax=Arundo donax TaxID=35708 RepID=A0A0A9B3A7_ARUDO
MLPCIQSCLSV